MTVFGKRYLAAFAATAVLALGLYGCGGGGPTTMMPEYVDGLTRGDPQNLASTIDEVANYDRMEGPNYTFGWWHSNATGGAEYGASVSQVPDGGAYAYAIASHDESGQLQFNVTVIQQDPLQSANPFVLDGRYINTIQDNADLEGLT
jgi:hypothetical protein